MTKLSKRIIVLLVACFMMLSAAISQSAISVNAERESIISVTIEHENPIYSPEGAQSSISSLSDAEINSLEDSIDESVIEYLRSELVKRSNPISLTIPYLDEYSDAAGYMWYKAAETHTGNPEEGDYINFQYSNMSCNVSGNRTKLTYTYEVTYYTDYEQEQKMDEAVDALLDDLNIRRKNDYQKIYTIYEWIAKHVSYEYNHTTVDTKLIYSAYGALINRVAVCQGYAVLFYRLMLELGIDCRVIAGIGNGGPHAWNIVKLKDKYYDVDVTWASTSGMHSEFFLRGSKNFGDHFPNDEYLTDEFKSEYPIDPNDYKVTEEDLDTDDNDKVKGITLDQKSAKLAADDTLQLTATVTPSTAGNKKVKWTVNNKIATVDENGLVTMGRSYGTAKVTATTEDGGYKATCTIEMQFKDVTDLKAYYYKPVYWAAKKSITKGYPEEGTFKPQDNCTREAVVTFLWRLAGKPEPKSMESPFSDVTDPDAYYYKAVLWAAEKKITGGYSDGTFRPGDTCLREHVVTFLYRYAGKPKVNTANTFTDVDEDDYYYKAVLWAADKGITKGYADDNYATFRPDLDCLREHVVTFLYRYANLK